MFRNGGFQDRSDRITVGFSGFSDRLSHRRQEGTDGGHPQICGEQRALEFFVELRSDTPVRGQQAPEISEEFFAGLGQAFPGAS